MPKFSDYALTSAGAKAVRPAFTVTPNCPIYYLSDYCVGDGATDDTAALNAAFALAASVGTGATFIADGVYSISDTVLIGQNVAGSPASFISLISPGGAGAATFRYHGTNDRPALRFAKNKRFYVRGIELQNFNTGSGLGSSIGIQLGGQGGSVDPGTETLGAVFEDVGISSFNVGIQDGNFGDSSEILWVDLFLDDCNTGWTSTGFNTLDHCFVMLSMSSCGIGLDSGAAEGFHVYGGSSSGATIADFKVQGNGICDITAFRNENSAGFVIGTGGSVALKNCNVLNSVLASNINLPVPGGISVSGTFDKLVIDSCGLNGWISPTRAKKVFITNSLLQVDPNNGLPIIYPETDLATLARVFLKNNRSQQFPLLLTHDFDGFITGGQFPVSPGTTLITPTSKKIQQLAAPVANSGQTYGADSNAFCYVRHLSEGPLQGVTTPTTQTTTTSAATLAGSNVLTVSAVPSWLTPGMIVTDTTTPSAIPFNTSILYFSATAIYLSANITSPGVGSGDTLTIYTYYGSSYAGNNLRVSGTFVSSGTLSFTFTRSLTINTGVGQNSKFTATAGNFFLTDAGKPIKIAGQGNHSWTDWFGYGVSYIDSTHLVSAPAGGQAAPTILSSGGGATAIIGQNEPDANYIVASIVGNAATPETYSITGQSASGFTLVSSNASSTATVTCMIVR